jgi:hypothetical protein
MCCFSVARPASWLGRLFRPKVYVARTNILGRMISPGVQALAYGMDLASERAVAMVLPLPVVPGSGDDAVRFISLEEHPTMFMRLSVLFDVWQTRSAPKSGGPLRLATSKLVVHKIGSFVASYVPTRADFSRLDPRFRLPDVLFNAIPAYADYGFAVFQLAPDESTIHPMAFSFPTRDPERLFFPTVHLHDGTFHPAAKFDHSLYYQHPRCTTPGEPPHNLFGTQNDEVSFLTSEEGFEGLVEPGRPLLRRPLRGKLPNADTWISLA